MLVLKKTIIGILIILMTLEMVSSAPMKIMKNNPIGWLNPINQQKKTKTQPTTTITVSPEDIGRYINQIRSAPWSMV
jgi:hypothetical protein